MANTYLTRTQTTGNRKTWTWSAWVKFSKIAIGEHDQKLFLAHNNTHPSTQIITNSMRLGIYTYDGASTNFNVTCNRYLRDSSGWFHLVIAVDTTQSTASDRVKIYINGVQETSFLTASYPSQNFDTQVNLNNVIAQVSGGGTPSNAFDGSMSHIHFIDGTAYDASAFGQTDTITGEWIAKTSPSVTYGTNGFFILKDGNGITDQSGEGNDFTLGGGTLTDLKDNPDNVFTTWNPLSPNDSITYSYGNGVVTGSNATNYSMSCSTTLGASSGKYYWEMKYSTAAGNGNECIGVANFDNYEYNQNITQGTTGYVSLRWDGEREINGATTSNYFTPPSTGAVLMCAMDMDNGKVFFGSNGTWFGSGNPVTGANPTADILTSGTWGGILRYLSSKWECNFGNGYFADNTVSSAGTNASGIGIFEYDVPTGYTALSTKGLNL